MGQFAGQSVNPRSPDAIGASGADNMTAPGTSGLTGKQKAAFRGVNMARRRIRELDIAPDVAKLAGLVVVAVMLLPLVGKNLLTLGFYLLGAIVLAGVIAAGVYLIRRTERKRPCDNNDDTTLEVTREPPASPLEVMRPKAKTLTTSDFIKQLRSIDWFQFEKLVALVYRKHGYDVARRGGANPDGGIDLVIEKDGQRSAVQCKQWKTWNVGVKAMREFLGALIDAEIQKGIFITLCGYSAEAKQLAEKHGIEIVNETGLARMLESTDAESDPESLAILRDPRKFCPKCESEMVLRTAGKGSGAGKQFWGCSTYPRCNFTMPI